ncbi:tachykinin-like peptides receptor 86C [Ornithodoros turicata]|uniref:tachykinin-like peptides receptor 86C n=1 Tax=Ornithodoros turicata TaxID=34597 RepID=UPI00313881E2
MLVPDLLDHLINMTSAMPAFANLSSLYDDVYQANVSSAVIEVKGERQFVLSPIVQILYVALFGGMVVAAIVGNAIVVWIVLAHRRMRSVTNYFLLNLSLADMMTATFNTSFNFLYMLESHWAFGKTYCVFNNFVASLTVASSSFTIAAMSIDRYFAIVQPLCRRLPRWLAVAIICAIWACSALLCLPALMYTTTNSYRYPDRSVRTVCTVVWPNELPPPFVSYTEYVYDIVFLLLTYLVPVLTMAVTYTRMGMVLWGSKCIGEVTELQRNALRNKQKVVRMLITVVTLFTVCWLPYHIYFLYVFHHPNATYSDYTQHVYLAMYWLAMSHAMYNPMVYYIMNKRFNTYFKRILCCCLPRQLAAKCLPNATGRSNEGSRTWTQRFSLKQRRRHSTASKRQRHDDLNGNPVVHKGSINDGIACL